MAVSLLIGIVVGAAAASGSRFASTLLLGLTDFGLGMPRVVLLLLLASLWQPSAILVVVVLGITGWMPVARLVYAETRSQLARPYVEAARALGATRLRLLVTHALPNGMATARFLQRISIVPATRGTTSATLDSRPRALGNSGFCSNPSMNFPVTFSPLCP